MRKLIVNNLMSLDGYFEGPDHNVMVLPLDHAFDAYCAERLRSAETLLLGRTTYEGFKGFWPSMADNPQATPTQREISRRDNEVAKVESVSIRADAVRIEGDDKIPAQHLSARHWRAAA